MKTLLPPVTGTLAVLLVVLLIFLARQNRAINELHTRAQAERTDFEQQQEELRRVGQERDRKLRDAADTVAQLQRELAVARAAAGIEPDRDRIAADPAVTEFRHRQQRRIVQERYGDLFDRLSLSPGSLEELKRLLIELEEPTAPKTAPSTSEAASNGTQTAPSPARRTAAEVHEEIYRLLGYEDYTAFDRYGRELTSARPVVRRFANDAADAGHPLTAVQRSALARVIFEATDPQINPEAAKPGANTPDPATSLTPLDSLVLARATDVLSPPQLDLLRTFRIQEREGLAAWRNSLKPATNAPAGAAPIKQ